MIRAVLFDLDGTLYDRDELVRQIARHQHHAFRDHLRNVEEGQFIERVVALDDHGYGSKPELYARLVAEYGLAAELVDRMESHFWETYDRTCRPSEDTLSVLSTLRREGKTLGVVTNGSVARQEAKLKALGLLQFFDVVLISEAEGLKKPDVRIFQRAVERCGVSPFEAMFVGDHPEIDVAGARRAGLEAIWKRVPYWNLMLDDVFVIERLSELLPICLAQSNAPPNKSRTIVAR